MKVRVILLPFIPSRKWRGKGLFTSFSRLKGAISTNLHHVEDMMRGTL